MIIKNTSVLVCALALQVLTTSAVADWSDLGSTENRSWYIGTGVGITELDPDTGNSGYSVTDEQGTGFKIFGGYDYSERLTIEGFYADLGSAQLKSSFLSQPDAEVDYSTLGVSALWYFIRNGDNKGKDLRKGLQVYAHGGLSFLSNSSSINFSQDNSVQVQYGAGLEYGLNNGISLRAGLDLYDKDAGMVFVSVMKRFGKKSKRKVIVEPAPVVEPVVESIPVVVILDTDNDGILDVDDKCADSSENIRVDEKGCLIIAVEIEGINFEPESFDLTADSKLILNEAVIVIKENLELQIEVQAYTDYKGSSKENLKLSEQRASSVKAYLVSQGISEDRLVSKGYGEDQPIADNKTEEGRAKNRRVELKVINNGNPVIDNDATIDDELSNSINGLESAVEKSADHETKVKADKVESDKAEQNEESSGAEVLDDSVSESSKTEEPK